jgi:hypothetical protein
MRSTKLSHTPNFVCISDLTIVNYNHKNINTLEEKMHKKNKAHRIGALVLVAIISLSMLVVYGGF